MRHPKANPPIEPSTMPERIEPQLASAAKQAPERGAWVYEIKFDGFRMLARIDARDVRLITRGGHDWTQKLRHLQKELDRLPVKQAWLDSEIAVLSETGRPDFNALQNAFDRKRTVSIVMFVFDLMWLDGVDLRPLPLAERRRKLEHVMRDVDSEHLRVSQAFPNDLPSLLAAARTLKLEGLMGKRADAPYRSGRTATWLKFKCGQRQEFVIGGFIRGDGTTGRIAFLLLGLFDIDGDLRYVGRVQPTIKGRGTDLFLARARELTQYGSPFQGRPRDAHSVIWLRPELVCEVSFVEWTKAGKLRHPIFEGMRTDKNARDVTAEVAIDPEATEPTIAARGAAIAAGVRISNPGRVVDVSSGHTKLEVARYYEAIAEWMLPHIHNRPLSIVRAPEGIGGKMFFQKHAERAPIPGVEELRAGTYPDQAPLMLANTSRALVGLAQMGVIELHSWNASAPDLEHPDRVIFDLDPDPALPWSRMLEAAQMMKVVLDELTLRSFVKTSGGKGLHIVVPLTGKLGWSEVKAFSKALARHVAHVVPDRFSAVSGPRNRVGRIFIDYLRNARGATSAAEFSVRARPGMGVSMPVSWEELDAVTGGAQWSMQSAVVRQRRLGFDAWAGYPEVSQTITLEMLDALDLP
ncbi:DNA ligase D [Paraburkholderia sp. J8-2]|uniref:DNA ligase D n=1 Tax=Paraburkholderia sp. J8-2 TaxID=2805440 RepID=UPI002AB7CC46|nr:DNA ligase D [Paraburkholderia sp. J8-2]